MNKFKPPIFCCQMPERNIKYHFSFNHGPSYNGVASPLDAFYLHETHICNLLTVKQTKHIYFLL